MFEGKVITYLQRLTGAPIEAASTLRLTSAQRAAFASWMRREGIDFVPATLQQGTFSISALLNNDVTTNEAAPPPLRAAPVASRIPYATPSRLQIGIDLEQIASLPDASDFREHEFYRDNFTPAEIAYCLQRPDPKASLCGLWAAKEAIVKARGSAKLVEGLCSIEIRHDNDGRPRYDGGELSISHSGGFCVAVFASSRHSSA